MVQSTKDTRVPTFIQFPEDDKAVSKDKKKRKTTRKTEPKSKMSNDGSEKEAPVTETKKRKRKTTTTKPSKKQSKTAIKRDDIDEDFTNIQETPVVEAKDQIWIGAAFIDGRGSYTIYYGEDDERNFSALCGNEHRVRDLDYVYVLATAVAIEKLNSDSSSPLIIYTGCRDLPRAISEGEGFSHYATMIKRICESIKEKAREIQVRHVSTRHLSKEQKAAIELATKALEAPEQVPQEVEEQQPENVTDIVENVPTETIEIEKDTKDISISVEKEVIVKEDIIVQEEKEEEDIVMEEAEQPKQEQEPTLARTSSWTAVFSNIWDTLSSPFKPKK
ncbi:hypothetical protein BCV72DRAFT_52776 [Rhizopus microsporus var. microsporus]|uniref:Uncharacterized protein n=1 Tax=Rhizopus microsporus var. microsporus TaxID=86635 RepID=A0A1X0RD61_RHIZD|nr:hypothetical protein BCV72DRAFT_52776 [Rhizopus microsporus var. microsporus]